MQLADSRMFASHGELDKTTIDAWLQRKVNQNLQFTAYIAPLLWSHNSNNNEPVFPRGHHEQRSSSLQARRKSGV